MKLKLPKPSLIKMKSSLSSLVYSFKEAFIFITLISLYAINELLINKLLRARFLPKKFSSNIQIKFSKFYLGIVRRIDNSAGKSISKLDLIHLALRNMQVKKTRTYITIGGVSLGIGAIVFLVSIGYGLRGLVLSRVARLDELKQADVLTQPGSSVRLTDTTMSNIKGLSNVAEVFPMIAVVGKVNYQNSVSDVAVYGVTSGYLNSSSVKPIKGQLFTNNDITIKVGSSFNGQVAGAATSRVENAEYMRTISDVKFSIFPSQWIRVREGPTTNSKVIGYTKRDIGYTDGELVWGSAYDDDDGYGKSGVSPTGTTYGQWIKARVQVWAKESCSKDDSDCAEGSYKLIKGSTDSSTARQVFFARINVGVEDSSSGQVLGDSTENLIALSDLMSSSTAPAAATTGIAALNVDPNSPWVEIADETSSSAEKVKQVGLSDQAVKQAVVNRSLLNLINLKENDAIGKKFTVSFVVPGDLTQDSTQRVESIPAEYEIIGVTPDDTSPVFYVPFIDLRSLGIVNYSQFKVLARNSDALPKIREQILSSGYTTQSVLDTVAQINSLFDTIVLVLGTMGMIALAVASLGMFNTLTISLLERTREVGLMKAMGMRTEEVQQLFLTESIIMGFCSGFFGLLTGFIGGKLVGLFLTFFAVFKGQGYINVSSVPLNFVVLIMILSLLVGLVTGIFPARRSKNISALNALRYE